MFAKKQGGLYLPNHLENKTISEVYDELNFHGFKSSNKFDDANSLIFARQLTEYMAETLAVEFDDLVAPTIFPVDTSGGPGLMALIQRMSEKIGKGAFISAGSTDVPSSDVDGSEHTEPVHNWATQINWTYFDMLRANRASLPLEQLKKESANYVAAKLLEDVAIGTSAEVKAKKLRGLFTDTSLLTAYTLPADGTGTKKAFSTKDGDKICRDIQGMYAAQVTACRGKQMFTPDTWVGTPNALVALQQKQMSTQQSYSAIRYLRENSTITNFLAWPALYDAVGGADAMFLMKRSPQVASLKLPVPPMYLPVEYAKLLYTIFLVQDVGGLHLNYPYTICYALED